MTLDQAKSYRLPRGFRYAGETLAEVAAADAEYFYFLAMSTKLYGPLKLALEILSTELNLPKPEDPAQSALNL